MSRKNPVVKELPKTKLQILQDELMGICEAEGFREISLSAKGVQDFMAVTLSAVLEGRSEFSRHGVKSTAELKELVKQVRIETVDLLARPWYALTIVVKRGYRFDGYMHPKITMDRECEPRPHGQVIPPEELFLDFIEFPRANEVLPHWVMVRL